MALPKQGKVGILGAGVSGLTYAYFLNKLRPDLAITVFEKSHKVGGWLHTTELYDHGSRIRLEKGPRSLRGASDGTLVILDILNQLGHSDEVRVISRNSKANNKYLLDGNYNIIPLPHSWQSLIKAMRSGMLSGIASKVLTEPFRKLKLTNDDESIELFFKRRFGSTAVTDKLLSAIIHGIYAGDVSKLSVRLFPNLQQFEKDGSIIRAMITRLYQNLTNRTPEQLPDYLLAYQDNISNCDLLALKKSLVGYPMIVLQETLSSFPRYLADYLQHNNVNIIYDSHVKSVDMDGTIIVNDQVYKFDHLRSTIDVRELSKLINVPKLQQEMNSMEYVSIFLVNIYTKFKFIPQDCLGFGFLVPKVSHNKEFLLGTIFDSTIQSYCTKLTESHHTITPYENITLMFGGYNYNQAIPSDKLLIKAIQKALSQVFNINESQYNFILRDEHRVNTNTIQLGDNDVLVSYNILKDCIPQYNVGYEQRRANVKELLRDSKLSIGGMCFARGVGVPDCVISSLQDSLDLCK